MHIWGIFDSKVELSGTHYYMENLSGYASAMIHCVADQSTVIGKNDDAGQVISLLAVN